MTFTPANWNVTQTVTVTGVDDAVIDGNIAYTIVARRRQSAATPTISGLNPADVSVINLDNDVLPTKFYVVNDASQNQTYEYNASGGLVESYSLNSGNTAPRGAASTIAGDKTWVVDANRKVYVYNTSGGLLGSWTAGTLASNATVEGIATNGTDVWIVDAKSDKVYKYTGAASRLSGSQNAASSFSLNSGNTSPKDIVTDGAYLWVVNDSHDGQGVQVHGGRRAGRQLDDQLPPVRPARPASRSIRPTSATSGSSTAATDRSTSTTLPRQPHLRQPGGRATFALAAGNTNPQGIADPPAPGSMLATDTPAQFASHSSDAAQSVADAALASLYYDSLSLKNAPAALPVPDSSRRIHTAGSSDSVERVAAALAEPAAHRITDDSRLARNNHRQAAVDDLFAQWESDPLGLLSFPTSGFSSPSDLSQSELSPRRRVQYTRRLV